MRGRRLLAAASLAALAAAAGVSEVRAQDPAMTLWWVVETDPPFPGGNLSLLVGILVEGPGRAWVESVTLYLDAVKVGELDPGGLRVDEGQNRTLGKIVGTVPDLPPGTHWYRFEVRYRYAEGGELRENSWLTDEFELELARPPSVTVDWEAPDEVVIGQRLEYSVRVRNSWDRPVQIDEVRICPDWVPGGGCLVAPKVNRTLDPGDSVDLGPYNISVPEELKPGVHEVSLGVWCYAGTNYLQFSPDYTYVIEVKKPPSIIGQYKEVIGIVAGTASAVGGIYGVYSKLRKREEKGGQ